MIWRLVTSEDIKPKFYLNAFPKSGLHLLSLMVGAIAAPLPANLFYSTHWIGTFCWNSWTNEWDDIEPVLYRMAQLRNGHFLKGHSGHRPELDDFMRYAGIGHVFIYRDLRDVAVSQAHHILNSNDVRFKHPAKNAYRALGDFDEVLKAVIAGLGPFPGIIERWELYAPWLERDWVLKVRFEAAKEDPEAVAREVLEYGLHRILDLFGQTVKVEGSLFDEAVTRMVEAGQQTHRSPTFRQGDVGGWREAFTDEHRALFRECDGEGWVSRLGYGED